jgi:hypothetical protein
MDGPAWLNGNEQKKGQLARSLNQNVENDKNAQADNSEAIEKASQIAMQDHFA